MESRFEHQQPLSHSGFVHSDAQEQHVGKRVKGAKASDKSDQAQRDPAEQRMPAERED